MPMKAQGRTVYKSMQGKQIDMDMLRQRNELTQAVGNAKVNARGDEIGPGGKITRKKEDVLREYYENSSSMPDEVAVKKPTSEEIEEQKIVAAKTTAKTTKATTEPVKKDLTDDWEEDESGNFVKKGD
jgi:cell division septation protein DedD